ncbi:MAG: glutamate--tRNA ligase [Nitrososphaerota archaeon]|nr:glutamate--tRNA ligase [Nitrososphaerota archaeon]
MSTSDDEISRLARKYALINALEHEGRAELGAVIGRILAENAPLRKESARVKGIAANALKEVNDLTREAQTHALESELPGELERHQTKKREAAKAESEKTAELPELPDAKIGEVVTRFPPEPNGYMHIGHAKAAIIGYDYSRRYKGKFILRFDDTNPAAEKKEYYSAFLESLNWLGITPDLVKNASDDLEKLYEQASNLIKRQKAYVCNCFQEKMRQNRSAGLACEHRSQTIEQNLGLWEQMIDGGDKTRSSVLRFLGDMQSLNTTMRDPVLFRHVVEPHPLKAGRYLIWPTYDFDGPVEDSIDGVTHAMRSKEYELRDELYFALLDSLKLRKPKIIEFSRLGLRDTTVSKRSLKKLIEEGHVTGWDDPRLPTIAGLKRRGILPDAIREFILSMGVSKVESEPTWDLLESINRKLLDPMAKRYFFVSNPVKLIVRDAPKTEVRLRFHPEKDYGFRSVSLDGNFLISDSDAKPLDAGSKVRLIEAYNVEVESLDGKNIICRFLGDQKIERVPRIQWVLEKNHLPLKVLVPGPLLLDGVFNPHSLQVVNGAVEEVASQIGAGEIFQLVRFGFCRMDSKGVAILSHK